MSIEAWPASPLTSYGSEWKSEINFAPGNGQFGFLPSQKGLQKSYLPHPSSCQPFAFLLRTSVEPGVRHSSVGGMNFPKKTKKSANFPRFLLFSFRVTCPSQCRMMLQSRLRLLHTSRQVQCQCLELAQFRAHPLSPKLTPESFDLTAN